MPTIRRLPWLCLPFHLSSPKPHWLASKLVRTKNWRPVSHCSWLCIEMVLKLGCRKSHDKPIFEQKNTLLGRTNLLLLTKSSEQLLKWGFDLLTNVPSFSFSDKERNLENRVQSYSFLNRTIAFSFFGVYLISPNCLILQANREQQTLNIYLFS